MASPSGWHRTLHYSIFAVLCQQQAVQLAQPAASRVAALLSDLPTGGVLVKASSMRLPEQPQLAVSFLERVVCFRCLVFGASSATGRGVSKDSGLQEAVLCPFAIFVWCTLLFLTAAASAASNNSINCNDGFSTGKQGEHCCLHA
jgi:hypothetical protein